MNPIKTLLMYIYSISYWLYGSKIRVDRVVRDKVKIGKEILTPI